MRATFARATLRKLIPSVALVLLLGAAVACGNGGGGDDANGDEPPLPARTDPQFGTAGNLLGSDRGRTTDAELDQLWVGFARQDAWEDYIGLRDALAQDGRAPWVGGRIIADSSKPLGFYFDPATTSAGEIVAETFQTTLDQLKRNPEGAAQAGHRWMVAFFEERTVADGE